VDKFYRTDFKKASKYPLLRTKCFNLKALLDVRHLTVERIAEEMKNMTWM